MPQGDKQTQVIATVENEDVTYEALCAARDLVHTDPEERRALAAYADETAEALGATRSNDKKRALGLSLGYACWMLKRYQDAIEALKDDAPRTALVVFINGLCRRRVGDYEGAIHDFDHAANKNFDAFEVDMVKADCLRAMGENKAARKLVDKHKKSHADLAVFHYELARCMEAEGEYGEAIAEYQAALEIDENHAPSLFRLALAYDMRGEDDLALEHYRACAQLTPTYVNALINLGVLLEREGNYDGAAECYHRVLASNPRHPRARLFLKDAISSKTMYYDEEVEKRLSRTNRVLRSPITDFELSVRSRNCLKKMNINTLGDLVQYTEEELLAFKNFGETSLAEIKRVLISKGLRLGMKVDALARGAILPEPPNPALAREQQQALMEPIEQLELSVRSRKCLSTLGIQTVGDLLEKTPHELLQVKNFGQTSLREVQEKLQQLGLNLREA